MQRPGVSNGAIYLKRIIGFYTLVTFQVNTLDETSQIQMNVGTNYTIGPRSSELTTRKQLISTTKTTYFRHFLEAVFLHEMAEGAVGNPKHVRGFRLHATTLGQGTLQ